MVNWLITTSRHSLWEYWRWKKKLPNKSDNDERLDELIDKGLDASHHLELQEHVLRQQESLAIVMVLISELRDIYREAMILRAVERKTYREIAEQIQQSEETARWRVHKARKNLVARITEMNQPTLMDCLNYVMKTE
jgi:RNA polymerase sigma factor (sigma-70 family)